MISCRGLVYLSKTSDSAVTDSAVWEADAKVGRSAKGLLGSYTCEGKGGKEGWGNRGHHTVPRPDKVCKPNKMLWSKDCL